MTICGDCSLIKKLLITNLNTQNKQSRKCLIEIIKGYKGNRVKKININDLKCDVEKSFLLREFFKSLRCRGFSYKVHESINLIGDPLREKINLRIALMPDDDLFYPPEVKRYLRRVSKNHYVYNGYRSIAFALGSRSDRKWYIFILQSDIAFRKRSYIKEHFRGWRKVLFANIMKLAIGKADTIYLCRAEDVIRCCHPEFWKPKKLPDSWRIIYDETAKYFNMKIARLDEYINIQTFKDLQPIYTNVFYKLDLNPKVIDMMKSSGMRNG